MENNLKIHPDKYCRTCLVESNNMKSLSEKINGENRTLRDILNFVANINAFIIHPLPKRVCSDCETILIKADAFKRRYLESESILTQLFDVATFSQIVDNIANNSLIKDENCFGTSLIEDLQQSAVSKSPEKAKLLDEKPDGVILARVSDDEKNILDKVTEYEVVKEEIDIEFDSQEDNSCDFSESEPLELKKETEIKEPAFICTCGSQFQAKTEYLLHLHTRKCNGRRKTSKLKKVEKFTEDKKEIVCSACNLVFKTSKALKIHEKSHSKVIDETGTFECTVCMRKFSRKSSWATHMKHHDLKSNIKFTCDMCKREFQHKAHLDNHILSVHTREKGYTCEICSTNFATIESLELHKDSHKIEKKHRCKICSKAFYMLSSLNDHLRVHTGEKPYLCSICGKGFSQKTNLAQHVRRHQGLKPFKCEHCDRRFVSKGELVAHTRKHSGAHPFVCDDCGSGFTTSSSLVKHRRVHTGERPYACDLCPRRFAASGTLKNHRRTHTGEKPFQCSYCEKAFVQRQDLVSHIRGHTGERPYTCGCGQAFRKASSLKAHVRLHGKEPQRDLSLLLQASVPTAMAEVNNQTS